MKLRMFDIVPTALWMALAALAGPPTAGAEALVLEGFETAGKSKTEGKVVIVAAADAVTEGAKAAQLGPDGRVWLRIPARALSEPGWLKIDTFQPQPVMTKLLIKVGTDSRFGYVYPGKDTLALPVSVFCLTDEGPWPIKEVELSVGAAGLHGIVLDNIRLEPPAPAPKDSVLLDFGSDRQVVWPGFRHVLETGPDMIWSGQGRIYAYGGEYPDPLTGDFAGAYPSYKTVETLTVRSSQGAGMAWLWATHYSYYYSPAVEYMVRANGRTLAHQRLSPPQMLGTEGLLRGKEAPWTAEWLTKTFAPSLVGHFETPLKAGGNTVDLANSQMAALAVCPRSETDAMRTYLAMVEEDLTRYRRQFVLGAASEPICDVTPTEAESQSGVMVFMPPPESWFDRSYVPQAEHRAEKLTAVVASGAGAMAPLVVVPCSDSRTLSASVDPLRDSGGGAAIPPQSLRMDALEAMPVVDGATVYHQPFLVARSFRNVQARHVYWFVVHIAAPEQARTGTYAGGIRIMPGASSATVPLAVEVHQVAEPPDAASPTFGVFANGDSFEALRSLAMVLPPARRHQLSRDVLARLELLGFNATLLPGPTLSNDKEALMARMVDPLKERLRLAGPGRSLIDIGTALRQLETVPVGTELYIRTLRDLVRQIDAAAAGSGLRNVGHYAGHHSRAQETAARAKEISALRRSGGRPAISTYASTLAADVEGRDELLGATEVLLVYPASGLAGIRDAFKQRAEHKTLAIRTWDPDVYTLGFYSWSVGADGFYYPDAFETSTEYNAFHFSGRSLLLPNAAYGFEPTLAALLVAHGMSDYRLAARCERMVGAIKKMLAQEAAKEGEGPKLEPIDTSGLEKLLKEVRVTCQGAVPGYDRRKLQSTSIDPAKLQQWRAALAREAGKLTEQLVERRTARVRAKTPPPGPVIPLRP